jgi:HPt (histidine-containing phosphotransfer) domain-containing protein
MDLGPDEPVDTEWVASKPDDDLLAVPIELPDEVEKLARSGDPLGPPARSALVDSLVAPPRTADSPPPRVTGAPSDSWAVPHEALPVGPGEIGPDPMERKFYEDPAEKEPLNLFGRKQAQHDPLQPRGLSGFPAPPPRPPVVEEAPPPPPAPRQFAPAPQESLLDQLGYDAPRFEPKPPPIPEAPVEVAAPEPEPEPERARDLQSIFDAPEDGVEAQPAAAAPVAAPTPAPPALLNKFPLDIQASIDRIGDDTFWVELMQTFIAEVEQRLAGAGEAVRSGHAEKLRHEAHTIKGSSAEMAINGMRDLALQLERLAQAGDIDSAAPVLATLRGEFMRLKMYLASQRPEFNV